MSSFKDLYNEIVKTQQDIAVTYVRVVEVENELKKKLNQTVGTQSVDERLNELQVQIKDVIKLLQAGKVNELNYDASVDESETESQQPVYEETKVDIDLSPEHADVVDEVNKVDYVDEAVVHERAASPEK
ncbi:hypothetical protein [Clostera anachoreta granulovirus]|uniref:Uncharacterized protein n=1 Tax=Clostera anachoreta granulovirus TaxID=283675 RepID=F4ZKT1_9BBAC|nr:hypothetical protein ClanGV_gp054 [Clostera anachoreta granulovirus]AEB00342.1 hypothetical protein [Clostera anachoreta granulovirus]